MYCHRHRKVHRHCHRACPINTSPDPSDSSSTSSSGSETLSSTELFVEYAEIIHSNRSILKEQFPKESWIPNKNDMQWCSFCLGRGICREIYGDETPGERAVYFGTLPYRRFPLLSIVLHLDQEKVKLVLRYLHQWFLIKGMKNVISMWMYALLACLDKDHDLEWDKFLETLYKDCNKYSLTCEEWQKPRASLIMDILEVYFQIDVSDSESD